MGKPIRTGLPWICFSQAEHDEQAQSILITTDAEFLKQVKSSIDNLLPRMERREIIEASLRDRGLLILADDLATAARASNLIAPEHLEVSVEDPEHVLGMIENRRGHISWPLHCRGAGRLLCRAQSRITYFGTARFFSALGVYDFQKRSSIVNCSAQGAHSLAATASELARNEHLQAHALSAEYVSILSGIKAIRTTSDLFGFDDYCLSETESCWEFK